MSDYEQRLKAVGDAEEVVDLLEHFGWTKVLKPKLMQAVDMYMQQLPALVLNSHKEAVSKVTKEELAGRIEGYLYVIARVEDILKRGSVAYDALNVNLTANTPKV